MKPAKNVRFEAGTEIPKSDNRSSSSMAKQICFADTALESISTANVEIWQEAQTLRSLHDGRKRSVPMEIVAGLDVAGRGGA